MDQSRLKDEYRLKDSCRTALVCVDSYQEQLLTGRMHNLYHGEEKPFHNMMQLLMAIENALDATEFPQSFTGPRRFWSERNAERAAVPAIAETPGEQRGALATFRIKVIFRQNASWQGTLTWLETGREENFRSALEMVLLIDSALTGPEQA